MTGFDYAARRARLSESLDAAGIDLLFLPASQSDLEYFTGLKRRAPTFGSIGYTNHWVSGAFFAPGGEPLFILTQHAREFDLPDGVEGDVLTVHETDEGRAWFARAVSRYARGDRIAVSGRTWAETTLEFRSLRPDAELVVADGLINRLRRVKSAAEVEVMRTSARVVDVVMSRVEGMVRAGISENDLASEVDYRMRMLGSPGASFDTAVWAMGPGLDRDATVRRLATDPLTPGSGVSFDFGAITEGYCSDFGRTVHIGAPSDEYERVYDTVIAAQEAGRQAAVPGATGGDVHRATRRIVADAGYGEWFRHRTGHCIGLDVHEPPYLSAEDETPLEPGMLFTIEPSVFWPGRVGARVEDVFLMTETGAVRLNEHHHALVAN